MSEPEHIGSILARVFAEIKRKYDETGSEKSSNALVPPGVDPVDGSDDHLQDFEPQRGLI